MTTATVTRKKTKVFYTPAQKEIIRAVKQAACETYEISETEFMTLDNRTVAQLRFYCFWILHNKASMNDTVIADIFSKRRSSIQYGIEQIDGRKDVYSDVARDLRNIMEAANNYPKKFQWCIH